MKKYFVMLLSAAIAFGSCACGGGTTQKTKKKTPVKNQGRVSPPTRGENFGGSDKEVNNLDVNF